MVNLSEQLHIKKQKGFWIGIGLMGGTIVGAVTNDLGIWLPVGITIGVALEITQKNK